MRDNYGIGGGGRMVKSNKTLEQAYIKAYLKLLTGRTEKTTEIKCLNSIKE